MCGEERRGSRPPLSEYCIPQVERPIFAFDVSYNRYTTFGLAHYFSNATDLCAALKFAAIDGLSIIPELRSLSRESYDWSVVSSDYYRLFANVSSQTHSGFILISGRFILRIKRKIRALLIVLLIYVRQSCLLSAQKYETKLPKKHET